MERRPRGEIDPFLAKLLSSEGEWGSGGSPRIQGSVPLANHPREFFAGSGEPDKRDLGPLPGELSRLAYSELLVYIEGTRQVNASDLAAVRRKKCTGRFFSIAPKRGALAALFPGHARLRGWSRRFISSSTLSTSPTTTV